MKRGQILGMPLIILFGLIVAGLILFYGASWILDLGTQAEYVDTLGTIKDFENNVITFDNYDAGSAKVFDWSLPSAVEMVCFYNSASTGSCMLDGVACPSDVEDTLSLLAEANYNVYLIPTNLYEQNRFMIEEFEVTGGNPVCVSNGGSVLITAYDDYVGIEYYG